MADSIIENGIKLIKFLTDMRKRDLLLVGFVFMFFMFLGVTTGQIPSPLLEALAQHEEIMKNAEERKAIDMQLLGIARLQLYLSREACIHGARTESEKSRCDRDSVRSAILGDILPKDDTTIETQ